MFVLNYRVHLPCDSARLDGIEERLPTRESGGDSYLNQNGGAGAAAVDVHGISTRRRGGVSHNALSDPAAMARLSGGGNSSRKLRNLHSEDHS